MQRVKCPFCKNSEIQVGFIGTKVATIGCVALSETKFTVDLSGKEVLNSASILCPKCNNSFMVEKKCDEKNIDSDDRSSLLLNLNVKNESTNQTILIVNNEMVPPFYKWEASIPPGSSINYTKSPDFYMTFIQRVDPPVFLENYSNNVLYELNVYRNSAGTSMEKKVLVPRNYYGDHSWRVLLDARDGIRAIAFSVKSYLLANNEISMEQFLSDEEIENVDQKLSSIINRLNK